MQRRRRATHLPTLDVVDDATKLLRFLRHLRGRRRISAQKHKHAVVERHGTCLTKSWPATYFEQYSLYSVRNTPPLTLCARSRWRPNVGAHVR